MIRVTNNTDTMEEEKSTEYDAHVGNEQEKFIVETS
jgi:hypothetical protein